MDTKPTYRELEQRLKELETSLEQQKKQQEALVRSRDQIQCAADNSPAYLAYVGADDLRYKYVNLQFEIGFKRPRRQFTGMHIRENLGEANYQFALAYIKEVRSGKSTCYENVFNLENGKRWIRVNYIPDFDKQQKVKGIVVLSYDITEQKQVEQQLRRSERKLVAAQKLAHVGSWDWDIKSGQFEWSDEVYRIFGLDAAVFQPEIDSIMSRFHPEDQQTHERVLEHALVNRQTYSFEARIVRPEGTKRNIVSTALGRYDSKGELVRIIGTVHDITDYRQAEDKSRKLEAQFHQSQKMEAIGSLAGGIAHDFNNMLSVIQGNISYACHGLDTAGELYQVLSDANEGARQAQNLTQQLLTFSKGGEPIKKSANLNQLLSKFAKFVTRGSNSICEFQLAANLWAVEIDSGLIHQAISNLLINAMQAMPEGGTIRIETANREIREETTIPLPPGFYVQVTIEDQGTGISEKHLPRVFDPFFTTKNKGSGLGLATTFSIINRHQGHILATSQLGQGSTFQIHLPATKKPASREPAQSREEHEGKGRILIMDDEVPIQIMVGRILTRMGYQTEFAAEGAQAVEMFREARQSKPFDLVILDLTVPGGMGGAKTVPKLLKIDPTAKVVVTSGYSNDPVMANYRDYGFCGVMPKPYLQEHLAELLNKLFPKD